MKIQITKKQADNKTVWIREVDGQAIEHEDLETAIIEGSRQICKDNLKIVNIETISSEPWKFYERTRDDGFDGRKQAAFDEADRYRSTHLVGYQRPDSTGFRSIRCLTELNGRPWNNMALNMVHALRPSCIRVTEDWQTLDAVNWRVTVMLESDGRTIRQIWQEAEVGLIGCRYGLDVRPLETGEVPELASDEWI